mgnify:CR=1 FL=1
MIEFDDEQDKVENLNNELGSAYIGVSKETNRYRDFQAVYKTSAGKRVLREIMWWGHINLPSVSKSIPVDPIVPMYMKVTGNLPWKYKKSC